MDEMLDYMGLGWRIRTRRKEQHMTQDRLAEKAGISPSYLGHIERGSRKASVETLARIAQILNVSIDKLLCDSFGLADICFILPEPENYFSVIRNALERLEKEYYGSRLT